VQPPKDADWIEAELLGVFGTRGIAVTPDAVALLKRACGTMPAEADGRTGPDALTALLGAPDVVDAYMFKYGAADMDFWRAVRFLADLHEILHLPALRR